MLHPMRKQAVRHICFHHDDTLPCALCGSESATIRFKGSQVCEACLEFVKDFQ